MGTLIEFILGATVLPPTINAAFAAFIILGIIWIFAQFLLKAWRSYHEFIMMEDDEDKSSAGSSSDGQFTVSEVKQIMDVYKKLVDVTENIAGKYVKKDDFAKFTAHIKAEIEESKAEIEDMKKRFGI